MSNCQFSNCQTTCTRTVLLRPQLHPPFPLPRPATPSRFQTYVQLRIPPPLFTLLRRCYSTPPHTPHSYKWADINPFICIPRRVIPQCGANNDLLEIFRPSHVDEEDKPIPSRIMATGTTTVAPVGQEVGAHRLGSLPLAFLRRPTSARAWTHPGSLRRSPRPRVSPHPNTSRSRIRAMSRRTIG